MDAEEGGRSGRVEGFKGSRVQEFRSSRKKRLDAEVAESAEVAEKSREEKRDCGTRE